MAKLNVYQFLLDPRLGGPNVRIRGVASRLPESISTRIVTCGKSDFGDLTLLNLRSFWRPLYGLELLINALLITLIFLPKRFTQRLLFHVNGPPNIAPMIAAVVLRVPVVWHFNDSYGSMKPLVMLGKLLSKLVRTQKVVSAHAVAPPYGVENYEVLYAPVDAALFKHDPNHARSSEEHQREPVLLCVGNLNPIKGHDVLLDALQLLREEHYAPLPKLRVIGAKLATHQEQLRKLEEHPASDLLTLLDRQPGEVIRAELSACTLSVLPSRSEACPIALLEAMSMRCVCIASDVGGVREMLDDESGFMVPPEQPRALADAIKRALASTESERESMRDAVRTRIEERFSLDAVTQTTREIYARLAKREL